MSDDYHLMWDYLKYHLEDCAAMNHSTSRTLDKFMPDGGKDYPHKTMESIGIFMRRCEEGKITEDEMKRYVR